MSLIVHIHVCLSAFFPDQIVGGMTWCIQTCNIDVDVDLLFQENSTIGQKMWAQSLISLTHIYLYMYMYLYVCMYLYTCRALTEKIVGVLPRMKCPHRLEPHQIQGLDFIHIYPVIQVSNSILYLFKYTFHII